MKISIFCIKFITAFIPFKNYRRHIRSKLISSFSKNYKSPPPYIIAPSNQVILIENGVERPLKKGEKIPGLTLELKGQNCTLKIEFPLFLDYCTIMDDAQNTHIFIGKNCRLHGIKITSYDSVQTKCVISEKTTMYGTQIQIMHNASCIIGKDCMFSYNTWIWGSDAHEIYDINTTDSLNRDPSTVYIGDHCWFGENSRLTKNASLADNTIVGCSSVVTKHFKESNIILAGNPAKIIKRNVNWNR